MRRFYAKGHRRPTPGAMNKTEQRFHDYLTARLQCGLILMFGYEEMTFKIAPDCRYTPDFWVMNTDETLELFEVKGGKHHTRMEDGVKVRTGRSVAYFEGDAKAKLAAAAGKFPLRFTLAFEDVTNKGHWIFEEVGA